MIRHVFLTGEIGAGKSTALRRTLALLPGVRIGGVQTYYAEDRHAQDRELYIRAYGSAERGRLIGRLPGEDSERITAAFDETGAALLHEARERAQLIVIDECGRLERAALDYHAALRACIEGDTPVLCVIRKHKAPWAEWIRSHPRVQLIEVTEENRDRIPEQAAALLRSGI